MADEAQKWGPLLAFDSDDPEFSRGFEAGRFWERLKADAADFDELIHQSNSEMIMRMCEQQERGFRGELIGDDGVWMHVFVT